MSPTLRPPEEVRLKRTAMSTRELRRAEVLARVKRNAEAGRRGEDVGVELSASKETVATISERRSPRAAAPQRGKKLESSEAREIPAESAAADPREVFGRRTGEVRTEAGSRTFSEGGWVGSPPGTRPRHRWRAWRYNHSGASSFRETDISCLTCPTAATTTDKCLSIS
jgi:hypothetical protein